MRFILFTELGTPKGTTHRQRYFDAIEEAVFAEEMQFDGWGTSEHHFFSDIAAVPAPETIFSAVAMKTTRIRLRHLSRLVSVVHPILIAEQAAATDILSNGRLELGTARGNTLLQLDAFGVSLEETKARSEEALDLIVRALSDESFSHDGTHWGKIPERQLTPRGVQEPHPPLYKIAQSAASAADARRRGLGLVTSDLYLGWDTLAEYFDAYNAVPEHEVDPVGRFATRSLASSVMTARCAKTDDEALASAEADLLKFAQMIINDVYVQLAERSPEQYGGFKRFAELREHADDPEWLRTCGPTVLVGSPEHCIQQIQRTVEMGGDEIVLRIDGGSHNEIMESIEYFGRYVIPYFKNPRGVQRSGPIGLLPGDPRQVPSYEKAKESP